MRYSRKATPGAELPSVLDGRAPEAIYVPAFKVPGSERVLSPQEVDAIYRTRGATKSEGGKGLDVYLDFFGPAILGSLATGPHVRELAEKLRLRVPPISADVDIFALASLQFGGVDPRRLIHYLAMTDAVFEEVLNDEPIHVLAFDRSHFIIGGNTKATAAWMRGKTKLKVQVYDFEQLKEHTDAVAASVLRQETEFDGWARKFNASGRDPLTAFANQFKRLIGQYLPER